VHQNAEELRHLFVDFDGKKTLMLILPGFTIGNPNNDWARTFPMFEQKIRENIGDDITNLVTQQFSTTGVVDKLAMQIVLMDVVESYFNYCGMSGCGIPSVQLTGTPEDWIAIRERAEKLSQFGLDWWLKELLPVLDHFVSAAQGNPDVKFWASVVNKYGLSGMKSPANGWIQCFFPYILKNGGGYKKNPCLPDWMKYYNKDFQKEEEKEERRFQEEMRLFNEEEERLKKEAEERMQNSAQPRRRGRRLRRKPRRRGRFDRRVNNGLGTAISLDLIPPSISSVPFTLFDPDGASQIYTFCAGITTVSQDEDSTVRCNTGWAVLKGEAALKAKERRFGRRR